MADEAGPHRRRVRYAGTHPRRFEEKYKELNPSLHAEALRKVMERGQTPAGTHRPICVREVLAVLDPRPGEVGLDATLGFGGHAQEVLPRLVPGGRLFGIDVDPIELPRTEARLRSLGFDESVLVVRRMNFAALPALLPEAGGGFDVVLADLGVSSMQIDNPARGFTFKADGPLDLRLDPSSGQTRLGIAAVGDAPAPARTAAGQRRRALRRALAAALQGQYMETTTELAALVRQTLHAALTRGMPEADRQAETRKALQRSFQALRIAVNDEFGVLDHFLSQLPSCLKPGGRVAILSFHSGEDRRVKKAFQAGERAGIYARVAPDPVRPSAEEQRANPRSSSAKLRWAVRSGT